MAISVLDEALGSEQVDWIARLDELALQPNTSPVPVDVPKSYAPAVGNYSHPAYGVFDVKQIEVNDQLLLVLNLNEGYQFRVAPWLTENPHQWRFEHGGMMFDFELENGRVSTIRANLEPSVAPIVFERVQASR